MPQAPVIQDRSINGGLTEVWLVRHGETQWSRDRRHTSTTDLPLTPQGEQAARAVRARLADLEFDLVLTSPRQRARRSAELAGFPVAEVDADLAEWDYGDYEGITTAQIREIEPEWTVWSHRCPGGESATEVAERMDRVVARLRRPLSIAPPTVQPVRRPGASRPSASRADERRADELRPDAHGAGRLPRCLVFGHGHALRALTARWLGQDVTAGRLFRLDTSTISVLGFERDQPVVMRWNG
ncbi:MAG: histidine phosphatase family protein [Nocardioides sp.]